MKQVTRRLILAIYPQSESALLALRILSRRGRTRAAVINQSPGDARQVFRNGLGPVRQVLDAALAAIVTATLLRLINAPAWITVTGAAGVFLALLPILARYFSRLHMSWIDKYGRYVLPGETLLIVEVPSSEVKETLGVLRESVLPAVFIVRPFEPSTTQAWAERGETLMTLRQVKAFAVELAMKHRERPTVMRRQHVLENLTAAEADLEALSRDLLDSVGLEQPMPPAAEWLFDNFHLIRTHIAEVRRNLPKHYNRELPALGGEEGPVTLRIASIADELVRGVDSRLSPEFVTETLESYQTVLPLMIAELWAFPLMWRVALVEELRRLSLVVATTQRQRDLALFLADRLAQAGRRGPEALDRILACIDQDSDQITPGVVAKLSEQLHDEESTLVALQPWLERELQSSLADIIRLEHNRQARTTVSISNAIGSLRQLGNVDYQRIFEKVSLVELALRNDPAGLHAGTSFETRDHCRRSVEQIARYSPSSELDVAKLAVRLASDGPADSRSNYVGYYLLDQGIAALEAEARCRRPMRERFGRLVLRHATVTYLGAIFSLTFLLTLFSVELTTFVGMHSPLLMTFLVLLAVIPASELAIQIVNSFVVSFLTPRFVPRNSFETGIPEESTTLVVVPMMLLTRDSIRTEIEKLEVRYIANPDERIYYSLLSDFTDATEAEVPEDAELLETVAAGIEQLNSRYPGERFLLFHRTRRWSEVENRWIGWERKRGKLEELNRYLVDGLSHYDQFLRVGRLAEKIHFVITLDSDTQLPAGTARKMIETISHPLNRVELSPDGRSRLRGCTVVQPRVSITLPGTTATRFTQLFTNMTGTDPYCQAVSDVYEDLFGEGIFHGKGIYDVNAFHRMMSKRFPEERLLSHDLIEGAYVGVTFAGDIELFESFPYDYYSHSKRQHRWLRGDWQIADWVLPRVPGPENRWVPNPLTLINRWKILDNLRRSLVPVASIALLIMCWMTSAAPAIWATFVGLTLALSSILQALERNLMKLHGSPRAALAKGNEITRVAATAALLPHQAWLAVDAITRVWYRRHISRRQLLEWETAQSTHRTSHHYFDQLFKQMRLIRLLSVILAVYLIWKRRVDPSFAFVALWVVCPELLRWIHRPKVRPGRSGIAFEDRAFLRQVARRTWRYFDDLVGPESNWLPPDNSQEALRVEVAQRTSPTNIGLWLTSAVAAYDFGYLTADQLVGRCLSTITTLEKLERYEGHFLNWYETRTLQPLGQRYVSTVDSGNLIASLWVLEEGLRELQSTPLLSSSTLRGLADTLNVASGTVGSDAHTNMSVQTLATLFERRAQSVGVAERIRLAAVPSHQLSASLRWRVTESDERAYWLTRLDQQIWAWTAIIDRYLRWMELLAAPPKEFVAALGEEAVSLRRRALRQSPSLRALAQGDLGPVRELLELARSADASLKPQKVWLDELTEEYSRAQATAVQSMANIESLISRTARLAEAINMGLLYDHDRRLFVIGLRVGEPLDTTSHYDLLASECRLSSLIAIAKGEVPIRHWMALGRPFVNSGGKQVLLSWNGTMFEYLMPNLFNYVFEHSLLDNACRTAVDVQIEYGEEMGLPWGISESAFSALDANQTYQYKGNGVPELGLKRGLEDDQIVSPYSTMLALQVDNRRSIRNLKRLQEDGMLGRMGFYEAIDYTRQSSRQGDAGVIIYCYMSHHQGMSLMALDNTLNRSAMQKRFHNNPKIRAVQSLLYEGLPAQQSKMSRPDEELAAIRFVVETQAPTHRVFDENTAIPRAQLMGNGRYSMVVTNSGGGYSRWHEFDLTRWRADTTRDNWGSFFYLRDYRSGKVWSAAFQPAGQGEGRFMASFSVDRVELLAKNQGIDCLTEITVSPEDDAEVRRITLTNRSIRTRVLEITSFSEISLALHAADRMHPAFSKMFVETEILDDLEAIVARRRPRAPDEVCPWLAQVSVGPSSDWPTEFETDRSVFIGRANTAANPAGLFQPFLHSDGTVLDPIFAQRRRIVLEPAGRTQLSFVTVAAETRDEVIRLVEKYRSAEASNRAFELAWTHAQLELRYLGIQADTAHRFQELASHMLYPNYRVRAQSERLKRNVLSQSRLWAYGISGDLPIATVNVADFGGIPLVRESLLFHTYWRLRGLRADLVILNQEAEKYDQPLHDQLVKLIQAHSLHTGTNVPGGVFLLNWNHVPVEELTLLLTSSNVVLGPSGTVLQHLSRTTDPPSPARPVVARIANPVSEISPPLPFLELPFFNGLGGFSSDGREYSIYLAPGKTTPLPWINVMASPNFGTIATESGHGMTWANNSQSNRLTPWRNDPVSDTVSDAIYIRDEDTGMFWTPTALPIREKEAYRTTHGSGFTLFEHNSHGIEQTVLTFVPLKGLDGDPVRIDRVRLRNSSTRARRLSVTTFSELTLGGDRETTQRFVVTEWDLLSSALLARNAHHPDFGGRISFAALTPKASAYSADRTAFLGRNGNYSRPVALEQQRLSMRAGAGLDPCAAMRTLIELDPGQEKELIYVLGQATTVDHARELIARYRDSAIVDEAYRETRESWDYLLATIQVRTPSLSVDFLLNCWLPYQTLSCRMWARSAFYQSGGAFGFRDQLQDAMGLLYAVPSLVREHILLAASRQFLEGDVQHWWQPSSGEGIRSHCSDDLLWLPYVASQYVRITGDKTLLDAEVHFLDGPLLKPEQHDAYFIPSQSHETGSVFEHCRRAIDKGLTSGPHGLPLIGTGDWNDGMNLVGYKGKGESVWLAFFLIDVLDRFADICVDTGRQELADKYRAEIDRLEAAVEQYAWDGEWYLRAYFDNGAPLGSHKSREAKIDSLPQSWSVIARDTASDRSRRAMQSVEKYLVREADRLILLFDPPFHESENYPGYIQGYPCGVRENGGQYTHAALWVTQALSRMGAADKAVKLLQLLNPVEHCHTPEDVAVYQGEPYVIAADVYNLPGRVGRCGWSWYTGSAGLLYRIWIEEVLGFHLDGDRLSLNPVLPEDWAGYSLTYRYKRTTYEITVLNVPGRDAEEDVLELDGKRQQGRTVPLTDDGITHSVRLEMTKRYTHPTTPVSTPGTSATKKETSALQFTPDS